MANVNHARTTPKNIITSLISFIFNVHFCVAFNMNNPSQAAVSVERRQIPPLPTKVIIGYTKNSDDTVIKAVEDGVNVIIWCFMEVIKSSNDDDTESLVMKGGPDINAIRSLIKKLDDEGYDNVVHLTSFGGWNGPHLNTAYTAEELYLAWKRYGGDVFDGFDWDLEGNDDVKSPRNELTLDCLNHMGHMSVLAKQDGYIVGMAPAESYLDITSSRFSRFLNLTYPDDDWHQEFTYHGANAYAYVLAKYGDAIDFISIQLYESYSHAAYEIIHKGVPPHEYLYDYVSKIRKDGGYTVDFSQDESVGLPRQFVEVPLSKLVIGFANGWADQSKTVFISPEEVGLFCRNEMDVSVRGFMFWCIEEEGNKGIEMAKGLKESMELCKSCTESQ